MQYALLILNICLAYFPKNWWQNPCFNLFNQVVSPATEKRKRKRKSGSPKQLLVTTGRLSTISPSPPVEVQNASSSSEELLSGGQTSDESSDEDALHSVQEFNESDTSDCDWDPRKHEAKVSQLCFEFYYFDTMVKTDVVFFLFFPSRTIWCVLFFLAGLVRQIQLLRNLSFCFGRFVLHFSMSRVDFFCELLL